MRLREKLEALQQELHRVETDIKGISRAVDTPDPEQAIRKLRQVSSVATVRDVPPVRVMLQEIPRQPLAVESLAPPSTLSPSRGNASAPLEDALLPKTVPDQRFATYFGSSSLHSVRPLRQERRVQRNKAIFMLIMAALLISFVLKMIF